MRELISSDRVEQEVYKALNDVLTNNKIIKDRINVLINDYIFTQVSNITLRNECIMLGSEARKLTDKMIKEMKEVMNEHANELRIKFDELCKEKAVNNDSN